MSNRKRKLNPFKLWDPTYENLVYSLEIVTPAIIGVLFWVYTHKPCTALMMTVAPVATMTTFNVNKFSTKIRNLFIMSATMGAGAFFISIFSNHNTLLIISLCVLVFICYISSKYIFMSATAWTVATFLSIPTGWNSGVDRLCEAGISFVIALFSLLFYEFICGRIIIKASIAYISELVFDLFFISTELESERRIKSIYSRYLYNKYALARVDLYGNSIFENDIDRFNYKIGLTMGKTNIVLQEKQFFFKKNFNYAVSCIEINIYYRKLYRCMRFIENYKNRKNDILKILPETELVIQGINLTLESISEFIKNDVKNDIGYSDINYKWINDFNDLSIDTRSTFPDKELYSICYGIKIIICELNSLCKVIDNIKTLSF